MGVGHDVDMTSLDDIASPGMSFRSVDDITVTQMVSLLSGGHCGGVTDAMTDTTNPQTTPGTTETTELDWFNNPDFVDFGGYFRKRDAELPAGTCEFCCDGLCFSISFF